MKIIPYLLAVLAILVGGFFLLNAYIYNEKQGEGHSALTPKDATYVIDGQLIQLVDGIAQTPAAPGSASQITTRYFGNEVEHDFDGDGTLDVTFLLTQETGGSGLFYYVVAALNKEGGYVGSQGFLLGDRIAPQSVGMGTGKIIVVNYADRKLGENFAVEPSVGKSVWLFLDTESLQFGEVEKDFEGEADPAVMSLQMKPWTWINATYNDGREILPRQTLAFTIEFLSGGQFSATTDCNRIAGHYLHSGDQISFGQLISTKMYCEGSQEGDFAKLLTDSQSYHFTSRGELVFDLKFDSGSVRFR